MRRKSRSERLGVAAVLTLVPALGVPASEIDDEL